MAIRLAPAWTTALLACLAACGGGAASDPAESEPPRIVTTGDESRLPDDGTADAIDPMGPQPAESICAAFERDEARRRAQPPGPCPHCPCACSPERGIVCAPCARCVEEGPPADLFEGAGPTPPH